MARSRIKQKKTRTINESNGASASTRSSAPSVEDLLAKARSLVTQCDYELAEKFVQRILQQRPNHADGKELLGVIQLETGNLEEAKEVLLCMLRVNRIYLFPLSLCSLKTFKSLIPPAPGAPIPAPPSAHLYLAQLSEDDPHIALKHYEAAVELLVAQLKGKERAVGGEGNRK